MPRLVPSQLAPPMEKPGAGVQLRLGNPTNAGLILCTILAEGGGTTVRNLLNSSPVGTCATANTVFTDSAKGKALTVTSTSTNNYASFAGSQYQFERTQPFSFEVLYFVPSVSQENCMFGNLDGAGVTGYFCTITTSGQVRFGLRGTPSANGIEVRTASSTIVANTWNHIVVTYDGSSLAAGCTVYINGVSMALTVFANALSTSTISTQALRLMASPGGSFSSISGSQCAKFSVWNRVLAPQQAQLLYANPWRGFEPATRSALTAGIFRSVNSGVGGNFFTMFDI